MKIPKVLLGAILVGMAVQTTGCKKGDEPKPKGEQVGKGEVTPPNAYNCPACGRG
ncbi:hypothetical protein [Hymenobacter sp.]|uniref:chryseobasin-related MNIO class RiPP peptide n=1 Tax=Hymenobacter sp. TaxID=1898978 RepID=UPI00286B54DA|nr:hypothetical protein [Hymenobacter sp.]